VGCGSFAKVSRVRRKSSDEILVWKELSYGVMSDKGKQMLCDEVNILRDLNHPNIVQFVDRIIDHEDRKIYIVQEYCNGGDLASYIKLKKEKVPKGKISETFVWSVTAEIASALQHCHNHFKQRGHRLAAKRRILHRDLKPGNVFLVKRRGTYSVKLGDFGLAKSLDESSVFAQTHVGTPYYMSPEQIQSKSYNEKSDIWSLGCIVYEMAMLSPPFKASNYLHLAEKIKRGQYERVRSRNYSDALESAIAMMLRVDSTERAAVEELLCLPRIQFTAKMQRLDRRYSQLKKKEQQFALRMQEFESEFKKRSLALLEKERALKLRESEVLRKEKALQFASIQSTAITPNCTNCLELGSQHSDKSMPSDLSANVVSPSFSLRRATSSITSTLDSSKNSTMDTAIGDEGKEESPQKEAPAAIWGDLSKAVNLIDLIQSDHKSHGSEDKTRDDDAVRSRRGAFDEFLVDGMSNLRIQNREKLSRPRHVVVESNDSNHSNHSFSFRARGTPLGSANTLSRTSHRDLKSLRMKDTIY